MPLVYHLTHIKNVPSIVRHDALLADRVAPSRVSIADSNIKERRLRKAVPCRPGGVVADYVPFYFAPRSPMLFRASRGGVEGFDGDQGALVYLVFGFKQLVQFGLPYVITDGNAASATTTFSTDARRLSELIDWQVMQSERWENTPAQPDRMRRRQAELLVHGRVPLHRIKGYAVRDEQSKRRLITTFGENPSMPPIRLRPDWYFAA